MKQVHLYIILIALLASCDFIADKVREKRRQDDSSAIIESKIIDSSELKDSNRVVNTANLDTVGLPPSAIIDTRDVQPEVVVRFAETLIGIPYRYASTDPKVGFDCSGFITYVFNHFGISVPRSSRDFTNVGRDIQLDSVKRGDLILFTGTDSTEELVGHMGIIVSGKDSVQFIHSTSGKAYGVTITPLNKYYLSRFVKTIRIFN